MDLFKKIIDELPELENQPEIFSANGLIMLQDDSDGKGAYIAKWEYAKPLPKGMKIGK
jgi:hypothetical protein